MKGSRPQFDYSVKFKRSVFIDEKFKKLDFFIDNV